MAEHNPSGGANQAAQKRDLLAAAEAAVADAHARSVVQPRKAGPSFFRRLILVSGFLTGAGALWIVLARPQWLLPTPPAPEPPVIREASIRLTLVREAGRIEQFRIARGRLPASLKEAGSPVQGLEYARSGDSVYALRMGAGDTAITYSSRDPVGAFLGASLELVKRRKPQ